MNERKEKEKIETKGAYSHDLHEAIRDVRRAFANDNFSQVGSRLNALFDICAPDIREAINQEWLEIDKKYREQLERYKNAEYEITDIPDLHGWNKKRYEDRGRNVCRIYVADPMAHSHPITHSGNEGQIERETRASFLSEVWGMIYRERFRACIDCLDRHGELRKWREVEYGKV